MKFTKVLSPIAIAIGLLGGFIISGCDEKSPQEQQQATQTVKVDVFKVEPLNYTAKVTLPARVVASLVAEIRPQVNGIILKREFEESSNVTSGQSLYQIDPALYQANYDSALASLESAKASASLSEITLKRYAGLLQTNSVSQQEYDKVAADAKQAQAQVMIAEAAVNTAKVNLGYTKVYSPIDGYIGKSDITEGALVTVGQLSPLAVVHQLDPIYVDMTQSVSSFRQTEYDRKSLFKEDSPIKVTITFSNGQIYPYEGYVKFTDRNVSETTGTVTLRAEFPNPDKQLLPGMFIKPQAVLGTIENAVLVPQRGITSDAQGNYTTKVVNASGMVESRIVKIYDGIKNYWIVTEGINIGDQVIVSGLLSLSTVAPGQNVKAQIIKTTSLTQQDVDNLVANNTK